MAWAYTIIASVVHTMLGIGLNKPSISYNVSAAV